MTAIRLPLWTSEVWPVLGWFVVHSLWVGAVVWCLGWSARHMLRSAGAELRYLLAAATFLGLMAGGLVALVLAVIWTPFGSPLTEPILLWNLPLRAVWLPVLAGVWIGGFVLTGSRLLAGLWGVRRLGRDAATEPTASASESLSPALLRAVERMAETLCVTRRVTVALCRRVRLPVVVGVLRPVILLPAAAASWPLRQFEHVVLHELAHVRRHDNLVMLVQRAVESLLWFHPAVWSVSRWLEEEREYCCDELVLAVTRNRQSYARTLVALAAEGLPDSDPKSSRPKNPHPSALASAVSRGCLDVRIRRILFREELTMSRLRRWQVVSAAACCLTSGLAFAVAFGLAFAGEPVRAERPAAVVEVTPSIPAASPAIVSPEISPPFVAQPAGVVSAQPQALTTPPAPQSRGPQPQSREVAESALATPAAPAVKRNWGPEQAIGEPDTPEAGDQVTAWASLSPDGMEEWLICEYPQAVTLAFVRVHETYNPGALIKVTAFNEKDEEVVAWEGEDPTPRDQAKGVSVIPVKLDFRVKRVKIYLDSVAVPGWNEIDAVGIEDENKNVQWASKVLASTTYAEPNAPPAPVAGVKRNWGPEQAAGEPDTMEAGDLVTAWASASADGQKEWLLCKYETAVNPAQIVVHETYNPGAVYKITVVGEGGTETLAWEGEDPTPRDQPRGVSVFPVKLDAPIKQIKIYIDSPAVPGWNEIDAVGLRDADGQTQWAAEVDCSSTYAAPNPVPDPAPAVIVPAGQLQQLQQDVDALKEQVEELNRLREEIKELKELLKQQADEK
jgi:hypothetical protein